jgi:Zn-dependent M28 family amino/carboxypeptidase
VANRYHQPADEWSADWDYTGAAQTLGMVYAVGRQLADGRPDRNGARAAFAAIRAASKDARK